MKPAVLAPGAQAELEGAAEWYEGRQKGLALRFLSHVDHALTAIEETASAFPRWEHDPRFRKFVLQRFPYLIFYRELGDRIEIVAIAHGAREPGYWLKRK